jgi:hypothetical protein
VIALGLAAGAVAVHAGCGSDARPPVLGSASNTPAAAGSGADGGPTFDFDAAPPECRLGPEGGVCACLDLPLLGDPPNVYFVLDRSGSMRDANKWQTVRGVVTEVMRKLGPRAIFGATVFPDPRVDECGAGLEVLAPRRGDSPAGTYGPTSSLFAAVTKMDANGGTPTSATLVALKSKLAAATGKTFIVLATDGAPNCNDKAQCDLQHCLLNMEALSGCAPGTPPNCCDQSPSNCLDNAATLDAVSALKLAGIPTYVIGIPGSAPYASLLSDMAMAGGTAREGATRYYNVDTADAAAFAAALSTVAAKITATCTFSLGSIPPEPDRVNVYLDGAVVPKEPGWSLEGDTVTLLGATCAKVLAGDVLAVRVVGGCPTVLR